MREHPEQCDLRMTARTLDLGDAEDARRPDHDGTHT